MNYQKINDKLQLKKNCFFPPYLIRLLVIVAGAIKIASEKQLLEFIPKGTPATIIATMSTVAIENSKIIYKIGTGELSLKEGFYKAEQLSLATIAGVMASSDIGVIGATIGTVFGPIGSMVGGFLGSSIGYFAGSAVGSTCVKGTQIIREKVVSIIRHVGSTVKKGVEVAKSIGRTILNLFS